MSPELAEMARLPWTVELIDTVRATTARYALGSPPSTGEVLSRHASRDEAVLHLRRRRAADPSAPVAGVYERCAAVVERLGSAGVIALLNLTSRPLPAAGLALNARAVQRAAGDAPKIDTAL